MVGRRGKMGWNLPIWDISNKNIECLWPFKVQCQLGCMRAASTWRPWVSGLVRHFVQTWPDSELLSHSAVLRLYTWIGSILNPLAGKFSEDTRKRGKGAKTRASHDRRSFYLSQYDWLKGSHMTKVVWLPNETDYSYREFVAPNTPYCIFIPFL